MAGTNLGLSGAYRRTNKGHVDWYFGGGEEAYDDKYEAYSAIINQLDFRSGKEFGVWEINPISGIREIVRYSWSIEGMYDDGEEVLVGGGGGGSASIDDNVIAPEKTWSSQKIDSELIGKVNSEPNKGLSTNDYNNGDKAIVSSFSKVYLGDFVSLAELQNAYPTATAGQYAYATDAGVLKKYKWSTQLGDWDESAEGAPDIFPLDFHAALDPGETFGKYRDGDLIPAANKTPAQVILMAVTKIKYPSYNAPTATLAIAASTTDLVIGQSISNMEMTFAFSQKDAGPLTQTELKQDGVDLVSPSPTIGSPFIVPNPVVVTQTPTIFSAKFTYDEGPIKNDTDVPPQPYPAGRILAGSKTVTKSLRGFYPLYFGWSMAEVNTESKMTNLPQFRLDSYSLASFDLVPGILHPYLSVCVPNFYTLTKALDTGNFDIDLMVAGDYKKVRTINKTFANGQTQVYDVWEYFFLNNGYAPGYSGVHKLTVV